MFLIKKGTSKRITSQDSLEWRIKDGWKIVKPLPDIPKRICYLKVKCKVFADVKYWYMEQIDKLEEKTESMKKDLEWLNKLEDSVKK